ncbi:MAG: dTDP-4-dehydrorhamnose 3,5-epimerase family protein, partial [Chloroflexota bacterium]
PAKADLLELTLAAARKQGQTVTSEGVPVAQSLPGVRRHHTPTQVDDRGWLVELFHPGWEIATDALVSAYITTVRVGYGKGWGLHKEHYDRYFLVFGAIEVVLYDVRPDSPTNGQVTTVGLSEFNRGMLTIPANVWHAMRNVGDKEAVIVNMPSQVFDHTNPDKWTLPLNTPLIPYDFGDTPGW